LVVLAIGLRGCAWDTSQSTLVAALARREIQALAAYLVSLK
jgi:hypothetical protein